jgi:hypothetical protein
VRSYYRVNDYRALLYGLSRYDPAGYIVELKSQGLTSLASNESPPERRDRHMKAAIAYARSRGLKVVD